MKREHIYASLGIILVAFGVILLSPIVVALMEKNYFAILPFSVAAGSSVALGLLLQKAGGFLRNFDMLNAMKDF